MNNLSTLSCHERSSSSTRSKEKITNTESKSSESIPFMKRWINAGKVIGCIKQVRGNFTPSYQYFPLMSIVSTDGQVLVWDELYHMRLNRTKQSTLNYFIFSRKWCTNKVMAPSFNGTFCNSQRRNKTDEYNSTASEHTEFLTWNITISLEELKNKSLATWVRSQLRWSLN